MSTNQQSCEGTDCELKAYQTEFSVYFREKTNIQVGVTQANGSSIIRDYLLPSKIRFRKDSHGTGFTFYIKICLHCPATNVSRWSSLEKMKSMGRSRIQIQLLPPYIYLNLQQSTITLIRVS